MKKPNAQDVKTARSAAGLTQAAAADLVGISAKAWQSYEYSYRAMPAPTWKLFRILARGLRK